MSAFIATPFYQTHAIVLSSALLAEDDDVREVAAVLKVVGVLIRTVIMANFAGSFPNRYPTGFFLSRGP